MSTEPASSTAEFPSSTGFVGRRQELGALRSALAEALARLSVSQGSFQLAQLPLAADEGIWARGICPGSLGCTGLRLNHGLSPVLCSALDAGNYIPSPIR